jgi:DNA-binding transcriptional LysR family regulator
MKMELRDIEYFAAVAKHGHVGRAAEALSLSQPALSKSLRRLEHSVGAKLVKRTPKGVDLTAVGSAQFGRVRGLQLSLDDISREAVDLGSGHAGHLRIATGTSVASRLLPKACEILHKQAPKVTLKVTVEERNARLSGLRNGTLDIVVTSILPPHYADLVEERLYDDEYIVFCAAGHPLAKHRQLAPRDLVQARWATSAANEPGWRWLNEAFGKAGLPPPTIGIEAFDLPLRQHLVATSQMLGFGSREVVQYAAARFPIVELRVKNLDYVRRVGFIYRKDAYLSPAARRFIEILKEMAREFD